MNSPSPADLHIQPLPPEVRNTIYSHLIPSDAEIEWIDIIGPNLRRPTLSSKVNHHRFCKAIALGPFSQTCHQIRSEYHAFRTIALAGKRDIHVLIHIRNFDFEPVRRFVCWLLLRPCSEWFHPEATFTLSQPLDSGVDASLDRLLEDIARAKEPRALAPFYGLPVRFVRGPRIVRFAKAVLVDGYADVMDEAQIEALVERYDRVRRGRRKASEASR